MFKNIRICNIFNEIYGIIDKNRQKETKMDKKRYTLKSLAYLVDGYIELRENILNKNTEIPKKFLEGISFLQLLAIQEGKHFPGSLNAFQDLIEVPIGEWDFEFIQESIQDLNISHCCLHQTDFIDVYDEEAYYNEDEVEDDDIDVLAQAKEIRNALFVGSDIEEYFNDSIFYELFKHLNQEEYEICREGINNNLLTTRNFLGAGHFKGLNPEVVNILKESVYTKVDKYTQVHKHSDYKEGVVIKCSTCGALMERYGRYLKCPIPKCAFKKEKLNISMFAYNQSDIVPYKDNLLVLKKSFHNSIKFPGIAEQELLSALDKFNKKYNTILKIEKYPKKDSADFLIYFSNGDIHIIDVKDYKKAEDLTKHLNSNDSKDITKKKHGLKFTKAFIIVPNYLENVYKYRENFENTINNKKLHFHFIDSYIKELESLNKTQQLTLF